MSAEKRPGTYHAAEWLDNGDRIALGANRDTAIVIGSKELPDDEVLVVLSVPAGTMFRLT